MTILYQIILADVPWDFTTYSEKGKDRSPDYPTLSLSVIEHMQVSEITDRDCTLLFWVTNPHLEHAFPIIRSWGFTYKTVAFTWVKLNPKGKGYHMGNGYWTRANAELCLLATKGHPQRIDKSVRQLIVSPRRKHSQKPLIQYPKITKLLGDLPRIELFARYRWPGWHAWGNEIQDSELTVNLFSQSQ